MWTSKQSKQTKQLALSHAQLESVILERTAELQTLSQRLLQVQDDERRKIARNLHDTTGQTLIALKISVALLLHEFSGTASVEALCANVSSLADEALLEIRTMSYLLHPPLLDEVGFVCAAEWYVEGFAKRSGIAVTSNFANSRLRLPQRIEIALFRILQESLTNVHRHSGALRATVHFQQKTQEVTLEIRDFGHGIPPQRLESLRINGAGSGVGLPGMRERMNELGGRMEMESDQNGTVLRAVIPLFAAAHSALQDRVRARPLESVRLSDAASS